MDNEDQIKKISDLIEQDKLEEAQDQFKDILGSELSDEAKGAVLTSMAVVYMKLQTALNNKLSDEINELTKAIRKVDQIESDNITEIDTAIARKNIQDA